MKKLGQLGDPTEEGNKMQDDTTVNDSFLDDSIESDPALAFPVKATVLK